MTRIADTDIDIDFYSRDVALAHIQHVPAMMVQKDERVRHASGIYLQNVPVDPVNGYCAFPYKEAGALGYFKIDFLNNSLYEGVRDEAHLRDLMDREPPWEFLTERAIVSQLHHIHNHFGIVRAISPRSIIDLAVVISLIRPGKKHLAFKTRAEIDADIWTPIPGDYVFKKAHAIAYATAIVVQLNLLCEKAEASLSGEEADDVFSF